MDKHNMFKAVTLSVIGIVMCLSLSGCYNDILDPTQIGRFEPTPSVNVILDTLGVADEPSAAYEGAEEPRPEDLIGLQQDYVFGAGDVVRISIFELYQEGNTFIQDYVVTETGRLSIPDVGVVRAGGLTEAELEQEIRDILSPGIIINPSVTVTLLSSQSQFFSIVGEGVRQNGRFEIPRYTFRLTDAIAQAGGVEEFNVSYAYVSRDVSAEEAYRTQEEISTPELTDQTTTVQPTAEPELINLQAVEPVKTQPKVVKPDPEKEAENEFLDAIAPIEMGDNNVMFALAETGTPEQEKTDIQWVFENGKWIPKTSDGQPVDLTKTTPEDIELTAQGPEETSDTYGVSELGETQKITRVIKIPLDKLLAGDPRYNIIIRPSDRITVPVDIIGEFWVMGNVNSQGAIALTGRPITLKQAIASAGGLNVLAWPKKVEVVRRIGKNNAGLMQEETVLVDLKKIAKGQQPDFFIKKYDLINVGTHGTSNWLYQLQNAFRPTYGFGFFYDRNFGSNDFEGAGFPGHIGFDSIF